MNMTLESTLLVVALLLSVGMNAVQFALLRWIGREVERAAEKRKVSQK